MEIMNGGPNVIVFSGRLPDPKHMKTKNSGKNWNITRVVSSTDDGMLIVKTFQQ